MQGELKKQVVRYGLRGNRYLSDGYMYVWRRFMLNYQGTGGTRQSLLLLLLLLLLVLPLLLLLLLVLAAAVVVVVVAVAVVVVVLVV